MIVTICNQTSAAGAGRPSKTSIFRRGALSGLLLVTVSGAAMNQAKAEDTVSVQEVRDLKARLKLLEQRLDAQAKAQKQINYQVQHGGPVIKGGPAVADYVPPQPWDKKFHLNGITITPGGFFAAEGVWRSRAEGADIGDAPFGSVPFPNTALAHTNEFRFSARQSRLSGLVEGAVNPSTLLSGYAEFDFLGAANSANSNESNSYNPRIRHLYATVDWNDIGLHVLGGQTWSLANLQGKGISPRNELLPPTIDAQYVAGFTWARQPGIRITKEFGNNFWLAASAEMSQTPNCPNAFAAGAIAAAPVLTAPGSPAFSQTCDQISAGGGLLNSYTAYSLNHVPDVIVKAAWEPTIGDRKIHLETFGMYTDVYDRVSYANTATGAAPFTIGSINQNKDTTGYGIGGGMVIPVVPKWLDFQGSALYGRGIERYGSSQLTEVVSNPDGSLDPLPELQFLAGATLHATPALDVYVFGGGEKIMSRQIFAGSTLPGYGLTTANNSGCFVEFGTCSGSTKDDWEITAGFWDKVYEGSYGSLRVGLQYSYIQRELYAGTGATAATATTPALPAYVGSPKTNDQEVRMSFRYYPFDAPPVAPPLVAKY